MNALKHASIYSDENLSRSDYKKFPFSLRQQRSKSKRTISVIFSMIEKGEKKDRPHCSTALAQLLGEARTQSLRARTEEELALFGNWLLELKE